MRVQDQMRNIGWVKFRFFGVRALTYFGLLLIPVWMTKIVGYNPAFKTLIISLYVLFMTGQWFLLGKEIDHRFKIYFKVNSSLERVLYRVLMGKIAMILIFQALSFVNKEVVNHFFWGVWVLLGLFYSWPTRGKIIQETMSSELSEFRFLDAFERTTLLLIVIFLIVSFPELPLFSSLDALKLFFDPFSSMSKQYWKFMELQYFPFLKRPEILKIAFSTHFYLVGSGLFLTAVYSILREFISRRLSILGVFAVVSCWSFSKIMVSQPGHPLFAAWAMSWIWAMIWVPRAGTYRLGLFVGLMFYWGSLLDKNLFFLGLINFIALLFSMPEDKNIWYRRQVLKYSLFGIALAFVSFLGRWDDDNLFLILKKDSWVFHALEIFERKAIFILAPIGAVLMFRKMGYANKFDLKSLLLDADQIGRFWMTLLGFGIFSLFWGPYAFEGYVLMGVLILLALLPVEWIFQSISRLRNRRNLIFGIYALISLLDSHFEGRVKIFLKLFF